jgi:hypothetical protein
LRLKKKEHLATKRCLLIAQQALSDLQDTVSVAQQLKPKAEYLRRDQDRAQHALHFARDSMDFSVQSFCSISSRLPTKNHRALKKHDSCRLGFFTARTPWALPHRRRRLGQRSVSSVRGNFMCAQRRLLRGRRPEAHAGGARVPVATFRPRPQPAQPSVTSCSTALQSRRIVLSITRNWLVTTTTSAPPTDRGRRWGGDGNGGGGGGGDGAGQPGDVINGFVPALLPATQLAALRAVPVGNSGSSWAQPAFLVALAMRSSCCASSALLRPGPRKSSAHSTMSTLYLTEPKTGCSSASTSLLPGNPRHGSTLCTCSCGRAMTRHGLSTRVLTLAWSIETDPSCFVRPSGLQHLSQAPVLRQGRSCHLVSRHS